MRLTNYFVPTLKEAPSEAEITSHKLMLRAGLVRMLMAGVYTYLPLGLRVLVNIEDIIRQEMNLIGANELLLPALQPLELWNRTGRDKLLKDTMMCLVDRRERKVCLGPTHEEVITQLVASNIQSYKQLPVVFYQIQTKFRDEIRPRFGLVRSCEFIIKDAYSFDKNEEGLDKNYQLMQGAYRKIFTRCGLDFVVTSADSGVMGGSVSEEFMIPSKNGEDKVLRCFDCKAIFSFDEKIVSCKNCKGKLEQVFTMEVGHIFKLGTKYSDSLDARFLDDKGVKRPVIMGCYGIGVSRLIPAIIEQNNDGDGIIWPLEIAPYKVIIVMIEPQNEQIRKSQEEICGFLAKDNISYLIDDREDQAGKKFKDADLIGIPVKITLGKDFLKTNKYEVKLRREEKAHFLNMEELIGFVKRVINA